MTSAQAVATYLTNPGCKRALWLRYFDAPTTEHHEQCCGELLGPQIAALAKSSLRVAPDSDWQVDFARLFNEV